MTDKELSAIEARAKAATPGPWMVDPEDTTRVGIPAGCHPWCLTGVAESPLRTEDAQFIAHARSDIPALLEEVRKLREVLESIDAERAAHQKTREERDKALEQAANAAEVALSFHSYAGPLAAAAIRALNKGRGT